MKYTQKLTLSKVIPTNKEAGAGRAVLVGSFW
jgi:hypothetical protein